MSELENLFFKVFRNNVLKRNLFDKIKLSNKQYTTYSFYDFPLEIVIKTKNQQVFKEKLHFYKLIKRNSLFSTKTNNNNKDKKEIKKIYKWYLDFNIPMIQLLLQWKELDIDLFIEFFELFKYEIKNKLEKISENFFIQLLEISLLNEYDNINYKILNHLLKEFPDIKKNFDLDLRNGILLLTDGSKRTEYLNFVESIPNYQRRSFIYSFDSRSFKLISKSLENKNLIDLLTLVFNGGTTNYKLFFYTIKLFNYELPFQSEVDIKKLSNFIFQNCNNGDFLLFDLVFGINKFKNFNFFNYVPLYVSNQGEKMLSSTIFYFNSINKLKNEHIYRLISSGFSIPLNVAQLSQYAKVYSSQFYSQNEVCYRLFGIFDFVEISNKKDDVICNLNNKIEFV